MIQQVASDLLEHVPGLGNERIRGGVVFRHLSHDFRRGLRRVDGVRDVPEPRHVGRQVLFSYLQKALDGQLYHLAILEQAQKLRLPDGKISDGLCLHRPQVLHEALNRRRS